MIDTMIMALVFGNVLAVILESVESLGHSDHDLFVGFERISIAAFSAEFLCRLWSIIDRRNRIGTNAQERLQRSSLGASYLVIAVAIVLSTSVVYVAEHKLQPVAFASIPEAMGWAVCTLTTVGYGDVAPITSVGKTLSAGLQFIGMAMVALPTSLFAPGFTRARSRSEQALEEQVQRALADGGFSADESEAFARLADQLHVELKIAQEIIRAAQRKQKLADMDGSPH